MEPVSLEKAAVVQFGSYRIDLGQKLLFSGTDIVPLAPKAFETLLALVEEAGRVVEKEALLKRVWPDTFVEEGSLARNVSILRKVLGQNAEDQTFIETIPKRGYRFVAPVTRSRSSGTSELDPALALTRELDPIKGREPARRWIWAAVGAAVIVVSVVAAGLFVRLVPGGNPPAPTVLRLGFTLPASEPFSVYTGGATCAIALSPDGTFLVYSALSVATNRTHLYVRRLDQFEARLITDSADANNPFVSPDSRWIGFFSPDGMLKTVSVSGGQPKTVALADDTGDAEWESDDTILFTTRQGLMRVASTGGAPQPVTRVDSQRRELRHMWPHLLPGGRDVLLTVQSASSSHIDVRTDVVSLSTGARRTLLPDAAFARYVSSGHLIYSAGGSMVSVPFDPMQMAVTGEPTKLPEEVAATQDSAHLSLARDGTLAYVHGGPAQLQKSLVIVDASGRATTLPAPARAYMGPRVSPDGSKALVLLWQSGLSDVWMYDFSRNTLTRVTSSGTAGWAIWSPDGRSVVYQDAPERANNLFIQPVDGSAPPHRLTSSSQDQWPHSFSHDGRTILATQADPGPLHGNVWSVPTGTEMPRSLLNPQAYEQWGGWPSQDGRWLAYVSDETGRFEVYVTDLPDLKTKWQVSTGGGQEPVWSKSGRELFFREGNRMMSVLFGPSTTQPSRPVTLFEGAYVVCCPGLAQYDVMPDGRRFLMIKDSDQESFTELRVVKSWGALAH
jgi:DNA-binding winged helix-turn-helix (wHTH) protein/Tol biopolymer transport system component